MILRDQIRLRRRFDHQRELHRRLAQPHGFFGRCELRAVDDVAPLDQLGDRLRVESEFLGRHRREQFRAGLERGIVKLLARMIVPEMLGVFGLQERALVMVEPPGELRRAANI